MPLNVADIYCGAGGLSEGFRQARLPIPGHDDETFSNVYGFDKDGDAIATYRRNHFGHLAEEDQSRVAPRRDVDGLSGHDIEVAAGVQHIHVVVGGPNCQGVSAAGLRNPGDQRNRMFTEYLRLVSELQPEWFVMENVPGLAHNNNRELLRAIMKAFAELPGYSVSADVLLAADYGCPQFRYRLFVIGTNTGNPIRFPVSTYARPGRGIQMELLPVLTPYVTVRQAIGDLEDIPPSERIDHAIDLGDGRLLRNHSVFALEKGNKARIMHVREGHDWRSLPIRLLPERYFATRASDQKGAYGRLTWDQPAFTITASAGNVSAGPFVHPSQDRPISVREAARLQGFGDDYIFCGEANSAYRQVGNAVPPPLARAVAEMLLQCHAFPEEAANIGRPGKITLALLDDCIAGKRSFPVLTPRFPSDKSLRRPTQRPRTREAIPIDDLPKYVEKAEQRVALDDRIVKLLRIEAAQPGNVKSAKRAKVMLAYLEGKTLGELCQLAKVSESSIRKWVDGFYRQGMDGWRAHHTTLATLAKDDSVLSQALDTAVSRVRASVLDTSASASEAYESAGNTTQGQAGAGDPPAPKQSRSHMNIYLRNLIARYGQQSVEEISALIEAKLGQSIGTQYVGDLLAIADVVLGSPAETSTSLAHVVDGIQPTTTAKSKPRTPRRRLAALAAEGM